MVVGLYGLAPQTALAAELYVDGDLASDCGGTYDPDLRACGMGTETAFAGFAAVAGQATPGDTVWIRGGQYSEQLSPQTSGTAEAPIVFSAMGEEMVTISGLSDPALWLQDVSYVEVRGLLVSDVLGFGRLEDTVGVVVEGNEFREATSTGTTGGLKLVRATQTVLRDNAFIDANDSVVVQESERNLIVGNRFERARHSLLSVRCSDATVVRGNTFDNEDQKAAEIFDCEAVSDAPFELDATRRNLFDANAFVHTLASDQSHRYNGIQFAGQQGVVRRNVFYDNLGGGIGVQVYSDEALHNYENRIYNNTFFANACYAVIGSSADAPERFYDNLVRNNLVYSNVGCNGEAEQVNVANEAAVILSDNALTEDSPGFVDEAAFDLHLSEGSPMIDAAAFVARTMSAGEGAQLVVDDARYFFDGFGIPGEEGDRVQLEGQLESAVVIAVDISTGTLTLDEPLSWQAGVGVHLAYAGEAPDQGAFEHGLEEPGGDDDGASDDGGTDDDGADDDAGPSDDSGDDNADESGGDGGGDGGVGDDADPDTGATSGMAEPGDDAGGCGCRTRSYPLSLAWAFGLLLLPVARRRSRTP